MKKTALFYMVLIALLTLASCGNQDTAESGDAPEASSETEQEADALSTASIVNDEAAFIEAASSEGTWIIAVTEDLSFEQEVILNGQFVHRDEVYRKLAFYAQDEDRNITDRYTVRAPRLVVRSENTRIQGGTFAGDVYVEADKFHLVDARVDGDIIFANEEYRSSFSRDENSEVTGMIEVK